MNGSLYDTALDIARDREVRDLMLRYEEHRAADKILDYLNRLMEPADMIYEYDLDE